MSNKEQVAGPFKAHGRRGTVSSVCGTRVSPHNSRQLLVSTGVPSLDEMLGGGVPIGSILLLQQDSTSCYSDHFLRCFMAEGVVVGQETFLASLDKNPWDMFAKLPGPVTTSEKLAAVPSGFEQGKNIMQTTPGIEDSMKIAWRYEQKKKHSTESETLNFGRNFDLKTVMSDELLGNSDKFCWGGVEKAHQYTLEDSCKPYRDLYSDINTLLSCRKLLVDVNNKRATPNIMRICLHSLGSYFWGEEILKKTEDDAWVEITSFFNSLRALMRESFSVAMINVPAQEHFYCQKSGQDLMTRMKYYADYVLTLESFQGTDKEVNPLFRDYHGLVKVNKLAAINSLVANTNDTRDFVFQLKRGRLVVEKLYMPPDLSETASRSQVNPVNNIAEAGCSSSGGGKLDF